MWLFSIICYIVPSSWDSGRDALSRTEPHRTTEVAAAWSARASRVASSTANKHIRVIPPTTPVSYAFGRFNRMHILEWRSYNNYVCVFRIRYLINLRLVAAQGQKCTTVNAIGVLFDPQSGKWNISHFYFFALITRQSAALSSATQCVMPPEFSCKWGTKMDKR